jgi:hypothetical protein
VAELCFQPDPRHVVASRGRFGPTCRTVWPVDVRSLLVPGVAAVLTATLLTAPAQAAPEAASGSLRTTGIRHQLEVIPGMRVVSSRPVAGGRFFRLTYRQPVDHGHPPRGWFRQRLTLLHVGAGRPTVLDTNGYALYGQPFRSEPTELLDANQVHVEQRYFERSRPQPPRWRFLTIRQAATDHHRIVTALRPLYDGPWISTGASKGGMASVYHRRFFPDDVDGTVAYVAPHDVDNARDAYVRFIRHAGDDRACNAALTATQRQLLRRRDRLVPRLRRDLRDDGYTVRRTLGSFDRSYEAAVLETGFAFWQYLGRRACGRVPGRGASDAQLVRFVDGLLGWRFFTDQGLRPYAPYFHQASRQLGWPDLGDDPLLEPLLDYRQAGAAPASTPRAFRPTRFDRDAMAGVDRWVREQGESLLFVYGEDDPWSAEPFRLGEGTTDSVVLVEPRGTHGASIAGLRPRDRRVALEMLGRWAGVQATTARPAVSGLPGEVELRLRRR